MKAKNEILEELKSLSTVISTISRQNPYGLPEGYFAVFPDLMMRRLKAGIGPSASPFQVPEGYFEGFAGGVLARIKAGQGLSGGQTGGSPDAVPFESSDAIPDRSPDAIPDSLDEVSAELAILSPFLSRLERKTPYRTPEGYFGELTPILAGLQQKPLYSVPDGYFDALAGEIVVRIAQEDQIKTIPAPARVIPMMGMMGRRGAWWRYSAAAVVAALVLTIGWLRMHTPGRNRTPVDIAKSLYNVSDQEIQSYLDNHNIAPMVESDSIVNSTATLNVDENDVKNLLGDVPDGELKQYLQDHGETKDVATN
jgi:hypothetical protein